MKLADVMSAMHMHVFAELALILDFLTRSCDVAVREIAKLQSARPAPRKRAPARRSSRAA